MKSCCLIGVWFLMLSVLPMVAVDCDQHQWGPVARFPEPSANGNVRQQIAIASDPIVAVNKDGRLEVFAIGADGELWHSLQTADRNGWSDLSSLKRPLKWRFKASPRDHKLAAAFDKAGRMNVFLISEGRIWTIRQLAANVGWGNWGEFRHGGAGTPRKLWLVANQDGRLELFVAHSAILNHVWQTDADTWTNFVGFGWPPQASYEELSTNLDSEGRIVVGTVSVDNAFVRRQSFPNSGWEPWAAIGSPNAGGLGPLIAMARNHDGRLEMLVESQTRDEHYPSQGIYAVSYAHTWQSSPKDWSGNWQSFGSPYPYLEWKSINATMNPNTDGCLVVSALSMNRATQQTRLSPLYQQRADSSWNTWINARGTVWGAAAESSLAIGKRSDDYLETFFRGADGSWLHASQLRNQVIEGGH